MTGVESLSLSTGNLLHPDDAKAALIQLAAIEARLRDLKGREYRIMKGTKGEKQVAFHSSRTRYRGIFSGNRFGKSTTAAQEMIWRANKKHPYNADANNKGPVRLRVCADGWQKGVEGVMVPLFRDRTDPLDLRGGNWTDAYDAKNHTLHFKDTSSIEKMSYEISDTGRGAQKFASVALDGVWHDEQSPYTVWEENTARLIDRNGFGIVTLTPILGSTWEFDSFYQKWQEGNPNYECWTGSTYENELLDQETIDSILGDIADPVMRDIRLYGTWTTIAGAVYAEFNRAKHVIPYDPERAQNAVRRFLVVDPAPSKPTAAVAFAVDHRGHSFAFGELRASGTISEIARQIREQYRDFTFDRFLIDPNWSYYDHEMDVSREDLWRAEFPFEGASDDKELGVEIVRMMLSTDPMLQVPRFQVMSNCERLVWEFEHLRYQPKKPSDDLTYKPKIRDVDDDEVTCARYFAIAAQSLGAMKTYKSYRSRVRKPTATAGMARR